MITEQEAWPLLAEALADPYPLVTVADLEREYRTSANAGMWLGERSAVFFRLIEHPSTSERVCEIAPAAGDLGEILQHASPAIEALARAAGCTQIHIQAGRDGWARALKPLGYDEAAVLLRKIL